MSLYGKRNLADSIATVRKNTIQIATDIPEESYGYRATAESQSVAETLLHIAAVWQLTYQIHEVDRISTVKNVDFEGFLKGPWVKEKENYSKQQVIELLQNEGKRLVDWVQALPETVLAETVEMPPNAQPATRNRFEMLFGAKEHEMHHRAQLMVIERLLGIVPHLSRQRQQASSQKASTATATA